MKLSEAEHSALYALSGPQRRELYELADHSGYAVTYGKHGRTWSRYIVLGLLDRGQLKTDEFGSAALLSITPAGLKALEEE